MSTDRYFEMDDDGYGCDDCGAVVWNRGRHSREHDRLDRLADSIQSDPCECWACTRAGGVMTTEPTGHLPECPRRISDTQFCICDRLRACEARVRAAANVQAQAGRRLDRNHALDAARDAVAAVEEEYVGDEFKQGRMALRVALAAIDGLRDEAQQ